MSKVTITGNVRDITSTPDTGPIYFWTPEMRTGVLSTRRQPVPVAADGSFSVALEAGLTACLVGVEQFTFTTVTDSDLWSLIQLEEAIPPSTAATKLQAAVDAWATSYANSHFATPADITAAINALKAGAPIAYDTLMEIATKLDADDGALASLLASVSDRYTKAQADARFVRSVNGTGPDGSGNVTIPPSNDPRIATRDLPFGDGTANQQRVDHNMGTRAFTYAIRRKVPPFDILGPTEMTAPSPNFCLIKPSVVVPAEYSIAMVGVIGLDDVTPPSAPTVTLQSKTKSTLVFTAAAADPGGSGILGYNWFNGSTYIGFSAAGQSFTYNGLTPATPYANLKATALDNAGNESATTSIPQQTTSATAAVVFDAVGLGGRAIGANSTQWLHQQAADTDGILLVAGARSSGAWDPASGFTASAVSDVDGPLAAIDVTDIGVNGQEMGSVRLFYKLKPTPGQHLLTYTDAKSGVTNAHTMANSVSYLGVGSVAGVVKTRPQAAAAMSLPVASAVNDFNVWATIFEATNPTGFNQNPRSAQGADVAGRADILAIFDAIGAAGSVTLSTTSSQFHAGIGIRLVKAA